MTDRDLLLEARDRLLPGIVPFTSKDYEADILVDFVYQKLMVMMYRFSTRKSATREITLEDIKNDSGKSKFRPGLESMLQELQNEG
jgi:hypothetical protein